MAEIKEERLPEELIRSNIPLILNAYTDIFSDFDPRPFSERALSDDFLLECKKAAIDKEEGLELVLAVPRNKRSINDELKIKKRLKEHFKKHHLEKEGEIKKTKKMGWLMIFSGMVLMFISYLLSSGTLFHNEILQNLALVITEPAGWFFFWIGGEKLIYEKKSQEPDKEFYHKMASATISFRSY